MGRVVVPLPLVAGIAVLVLLVGLGRVFVVPPTDDVDPTLDAVVVLGGGIEDERLRRGIEAAAEVDAVLVLSIPYGEPWVDCPDRVDGPTGSFEVRCLTPDPATTTGEAAGIAELATTEEWDRVAIVTGTSHLVRAGTIVDRCVEVPVDRIEARESPTEPRLWWRIVTEVPSLLAALTFDRGC